MKKETESWLTIAGEDLQSAEHLFEKRLFRTACYHAQQAVEKVLKAFLVERDVEFSRTHNILDLSIAAKKLGYETGLSPEDAVFLNSIYRARYPSDLGMLPAGDPTEQDAVRALKAAREMVKRVRIALQG